MAPFWIVWPKIKSQVRGRVAAAQAARRGVGWFIPLMLLGVAAYLYVNLFALPRTPFLLSDDQVYFWMQHHNSIVAQLPGGRAATTPQAYEKLGWVMQHTSPGQFFFQAAWPGMYLPLQLRNPVFLDAVGTGDGTPPQYVQQAIQQLEEKRVQYVVWPARLDYPDNRQCPETDHLAPLRAYLRRRYERVQIFSDEVEARERK